MLDQLGAESPHRGVLLGRIAERHHHRAGNAGAAAREGQRLAVVAVRRHQRVYARLRRAMALHRVRDTEGDYLRITPRGGGLNAISAIIFLTIAWPNELWFSATMTNAPAPPTTLLR